MKYLYEYKNYKENTIIFDDIIGVYDLQKPATHLTEAINGLYKSNIYINDINVVGYKDKKIIGSFHPLRYGRIYLTRTPEPIIKDLSKNNIDKNRYVDDSLLLWGGFSIKNEYQHMGFGKKTIIALFNYIPELKNIVLYSEVNVGSPFWSKIGGEKILTLKEEDYDKLYPNLLSYLNVTSGDLDMYLLRREKILK